MKLKLISKRTAKDIYYRRRMYVETGIIKEITNYKNGLKSVIYFYHYKDRVVYSTFAEALRNAIELGYVDKDWHRN